MRRYVVGNSISALAFAFYNPDCIVIAEGEKKDIPFVFIQDNSYTRRLAQDLGLDLDIETVKIIPVTDADRIVESKGISSPRLFRGTDRIANVGRDLLLYALNIRESVICKEIIKRIKERIIYAKITKITNERINLIYDFEGEGYYEYDELIWTEHFSKFHSLCPSWEVGEDISIHDLVFMKTDFNPKEGSFIQYMNDGPVAKFVNNDINKSAGLEYRPAEIYPEGAIVLKGARFSGQLAPPPEKVLFIGRAATGNAHWRIEDSLFIAQEGYGLCKMLYEQQRFDYQLQKVNCIKGHERLSGLILHIHSELGELLREVNWKMNLSPKSHQIPKATSVLEEGIDVMKLVWAIFYHFQYTPREIYEMFWDKSSRMWDRLLNEFYGGL